MLAYALAALLLLAPDVWWSSGRSALLARRSVAAWMLLGAALQALPWEGSWSASGLADSFSRGLGNSQPVGVRRPISWVVTVALDRPLVLNAAIIAIPVAVGTSLWVRGGRALLVAGVLVCWCAVQPGGWRRTSACSAASALTPTPHCRWPCCWSLRHRTGHLSLWRSVPGWVTGYARRSPPG